MSSAEAKKALETAHQSVSDRVMNVSVEFLGITVDINDLGILGAVTFIFLLVLYESGLQRETENLKHTFEIKDDRELLTAYKLLAMAQVLTVPPDEKKEATISTALYELWWFLRGSTLVCAPLLVQCLVIYNDWRTLDYARIVNPARAISQFAWELGLGLVVLALTIWCIVKLFAINSEWKKAHKRLPKGGFGPEPPKALADSTGGA